MYAASELPVARSIDADAHAVAIAEPDREHLIPRSKLLFCSRKYRYERAMCTPPQGPINVLGGDVRLSMERAV